MGGAFSKKGSKKDKDPRTQDKQNRRLSVSGIAQGPQGDSNTVFIFKNMIQANHLLTVFITGRPERSLTRDRTSS
jgi:hypothetical protein